MKLYWLLVTILLSGVCFAQAPASDLSEADELFRQKRFGAALPFYIGAIKGTSATGEHYYKAGVCYLHSRSQKSNAAQYLEKAVELSPSFQTLGFRKETEAPLDAYKKLGDAYNENYNFDKAIKSYERYKDVLKGNKVEDPQVYSDVDAIIEKTTFSRDLKESLALPANFKIGNIIKNGSTELGEFNSSFSPDSNTVIYTLKVPVEKLRNDNDFRYYDMALQPFKNKKNQSAGRKDSTREKPATAKKSDKKDTIVNITTVGTSVDGHVILTYRNDKGEGNLYMSRLTSNEWSKPLRLPKTANTKGWEQDEFVTADGNFLYFVSELPTGYGGKDIYRCTRLPNGEWSKGQNLGAEINTEFDDVAPFLHPDGASLYFSSNRFKPTISYDVFTAHLSGEKWSKPQVVGYPVNSSESDVFYQVGSDKKKILAAAGTAPADTKEKVKEPQPKEEPEPKKKSKKSKKEQEAEDRKKPSETFVITFENEKKDGLTVLKGLVATLSEKTLTPLAADITLRDNENQKPIGIFSTEEKSGNYTFVLPPGKNTNILYEATGYLFQSENRKTEAGKNYFETHKPVVMPKLEEGATTVLHNIFFEDDKADFKNSSTLELLKVYDLLREHPGMEIKISNFMFTKDKSQKKLSESRAESVRNYLIEKGINKKRVVAKGERKSEMPDKEEEAARATQADPNKTIQRMELKITELEEI